MLLDIFHQGFAASDKTLVAFVATRDIIDFNRMGRAVAMMPENEIGCCIMAIGSVIAAEPIVAKH